MGFLRPKYFFSESLIFALYNEVQLFKQQRYDFLKLHGQNYLNYIPKLKHLTLATRAYAIVITLIWTLAFIVSAFFKLVRDFLPTKTGVYVMTILISILFLVLCCCNIGIWWKFQQRNNAPRNAIHQQNRARQARRLTKTLLVVSAAAVFSWLPHAIILNMTAAHMVSVPISSAPLSIQSSTH